MSEIEELKKEIEALKAMVAMQTATIEVMKNFHEAEKTMLIHAKKSLSIDNLRDGEFVVGELKGGYTGNNLEEFDSGIHGGCCVYGGSVKPNILTPSGVVSRSYCINTKTGEARDSIKDLLKGAKIGKTED